MRERVPAPLKEVYLSSPTKLMILLGGPNVLTRTVTEGILDRRETIKKTKLGRVVIKIAEEKAEIIKRGIMKNATIEPEGDLYGMPDLITDIGRLSRESYERTIILIRNLTGQIYEATHKGEIAGKT